MIQDKLDDDGWRFQCGLITGTIIAFVVTYLQINLLVYLFPSVTWSDNFPKFILIMNWISIPSFLIYLLYKD